MKNIWHLLTSAFAAWNEHEAPRLGAALAFYTILSLAPLMVLVTAVVALAFGAEWQDLPNGSGARGAYSGRFRTPEPPRWRSGHLSGWLLLASSLTE